MKIGRALGQPPQWFNWPRNEAVAALALPDVHITQSWPGFPPGTWRAEVSTDFTLYARTTETGTGSVSVRRVADDVEVASLPPLGEPAIPAFGPGGLLVRYGEKSQRFQLWDLTRANPVLRCEQVPVGSGSWDFRPDGRLVLFTYHDSSSLGMCETGTGNCRRLVANGITKGAGATLHPSEAVAATASYFSSTLRVLDLRTGAVLCSVNLPWRGSGTCAWSPDGLTLVVPDGDSGRMQVYAFDPAARALRLTRTIPGPGTGGTSVHFNPAGDRFAVRGWDSIVHLYDAVTGWLLFSTLPLRPTSTQLQFDPSGRRLAAARVGDSEERIGVWSVADAREYRVLPCGGAGSNMAALVLPAIHPQGASRPSPPGTVLFYTTWRPAESSNPFPLSAGPLPVSTAPATC